MGVLNFLLRRRKHEWLPLNAKVWVAGCGTQQALMWALSNPDAQIYATDISRRTLDIAGNFAQQLNLMNLKLEQEDLASSRFSKRFDLVVCTGVLHHLPDPTVGLQNLREAIKTSGAIILMVYNRILREPFAMFRDILSLFQQDEQDIDRRYEMACWLLENIISSQQCKPPGLDALELIWQHRHERALLADALLHPHEVTYDIDDLLSLLKKAGLVHSSWLYPAQWDIDTYTQSAKMIKHFEKLDLTSRWKAVHYLAGLNGPLMELIAEPFEAPRRPPYDLEEILGMSFVFSRGLRVYQIDNDQITGGEIVPPYNLSDGKLQGRERGVYGIRRTWSLPESALPIIEAFDGKRTFGEVMDANTNLYTRQNLLETIVDLFPPSLGLLAPC